MVTYYILQSHTELIWLDYNETTLNGTVIYRAKRVEYIMSQTAFAYLDVKVLVSDYIRQEGVMLCVCHAWWPEDTLQSQVKIGK